MKNVILVFSEQETNKGKCLECEIVLDILLLVCPCYVPWSWVPPLMFQELCISENLSAVVLLHNEGPVRSVLAGPLLLDGALDVPSFVKNILHDATVSDLKVVGAGATLLEGDLGLFVPAVDDELVMVHKSLEGVWQK